MVKHADREMIPELIEIWHQCFGDSKEYIKMFLDYNFDYSETIIYEENGYLHSAAYLLPAEYVDNDRVSGKIFYLYAAATRIESRRKGYFGNILDWILKNMHNPVILVPADRKLKKYYLENGFKEWLEEDIVEYEKNHIYTKYSIYDMNGTEYGIFRHEILKNRGYVKWNEHFMNYILHENEFCGGFCRKIVINCHEYAVLYRKNRDMLIISELLTNDGSIRECAECLMNETGCKSVSVCMSPDVMVSPDFTFNMDKSGYFNLTMG